MKQLHTILRFVLKRATVGHSTQSSAAHHCHPSDLGARLCISRTKPSFPS